MIKKYKNYDVVVIKKKIKNTYIRVKDKKIVVTTNYLTPNIYINKLIKDNYKSIDRMIMSSNQRQEKNDKFYLFGECLDVFFDDSTHNVVIEENRIIVNNQQELDTYIDSLIKDTFSKRLDYWYGKFEEAIPIPNLKVRKMKSRWGVCNTRNGNVTLNYYLYRYDLECLDYVIVHELSHFIEGNHSKKFWKVVEKYYPNYKTARKKLRS